MKNMKAYTVKFRRKREGKTDYRTRLALLSSGSTRVVIRKSLNSHTVQLINFDPKGDKTLLSSSTKELVKLGSKLHGGNIPSAYLVGYMTGLKAVKKGYKTGITDIGPARSVKGSSYYSVLKGLSDAGFKINFSKEIIPTEDAITGKN